MSNGPNITAICAFGGFVMVSLLVTWWAARRTRSVGEFYTAGSTITGLQNGLALAGDFMSAATFLGLTGLVFIGGADAMLFTVGITVGWALILFLFADRMRNLGRYTFADVVAYRLHPERIRLLAAVGTLIVAIPYLIAQLVGAGWLIQILFGLSYFVAVLIVGTLMTIYVVFGGMLATTWVQVIKAVLLLSGGTALLLIALGRFGFDLNAMFTQSAAAHTLGQSILQPGVLYRDPVSVLSVALAFICGTAGLPHVLMRFFTVPDAQAARQSLAYAVVFIGYFQCVVILVGFAAMALLSAETGSADATGAVAGDANMVAIRLSQLIGGQVFFGFISAVAFATILAVVAGILLSASASIAHDIYAKIMRRGVISDANEVFISRVATVIIGGTAIGLSLLFRNLNVAVISTFVLAIAASVNFPVIFLSIYWKYLTTRGAIIGGLAGLVVAITLSVLSPTIWVEVLGHSEPIYPYAFPTLFSVLTAFAVTTAVSLTDGSTRAQTDRERYDLQLVRSELSR